MHFNLYEHYGILGQGQPPYPSLIDQAGRLLFNKTFVDCINMEIRADYLAVGGNLHPQAADWDDGYNIVAFGAGNNVALWRPDNTSYRGIFALMKAHHAAVNVVRFIHFSNPESWLLSGSADGHVNLWRPTMLEADLPEFTHACQKRIHHRSLTCIAVARHLQGTFITGSVDGTIFVHMIVIGDVGIQILEIQQIKTGNPMIPLVLDTYSTGEGDLILAIGGTARDVLLYGSNSDGLLIHQAVLTGHEGWIRGLSFSSEIMQNCEDGEGSGGLVLRDILLASASQDKNIRLWKLKISANKHEIEDQTTQSRENLTNKLHEINTGRYKFLASFEALLVGHDDWVYSARWSPRPGKWELLTASADNSATVWSRDEQSGIWYPSHRLGDLSVQKGSTSATGSMGGLWSSLWTNQGNTIIALGRSGSWHRWTFSSSENIWLQALGISGHSKPVRGLSWARDGAFLLSASADQTSRLHANWIRDNGRSWHEFSRPQIHGYDLNCIDSIGNDTFISGADEKLLRVFDRPDDVTNAIYYLCQVPVDPKRNIPSAGIPVLGLSNKSDDRIAIRNETRNGIQDDISCQSQLDQTEAPFMPPFEDVLSKSTLWPEKEKLYGHGFEISALAVSFDGSLVATSCKASSLEHAVIRLFSTTDWRQLESSLKFHTLTVTGLKFSQANNCLLSFGRDRQWAIWRRALHSEKIFELGQNCPKAHAKMILNATWLIDETNPKAFVTSGREKTIKVWYYDDDDDDEEISCRQSMDVKAPAMSLATYKAAIKEVFVAVGFEKGDVEIYSFDDTSFCLILLCTIPDIYTPSGPVTTLAWRPDTSEQPFAEYQQKKQLAIASEDNSVRIIALDI